jgi:putative oxygen-independent coproporphyrinogen III oxidase
MDAFGVYVHVPFCARRCDYCAFATWTDRDHLMASYTDACIAEATRARQAGTLPEASSIFFGGGTPSRLAPEDLGRILDALARRPGAEVTVECNPEDASPSRFAAWRAAGVTRVSFGVQSMVPHVLESLGRIHDPASATRAVALAAGAGFDDVSVDLIFGAVGERDEDWLATLDAVLSWPAPPAHVSAYALTVEPGTALARDPARHPEDDTLARRYEMADSVLADAGYEWYEVSNWARPGHACRHNQLYWAQGDYRGIGCAAHSHHRGHRWWNVRTPERYVAAIADGREPLAGEEWLTEEQRSFEALALALRTAAGVDGDLVPDDPALDGLVERVGGRAVLTVRGRLLANEVTARLAASPILPAMAQPSVTPPSMTPPSMTRART